MNTIGINLNHKLALTVTLSTVFKMQQLLQLRHGYKANIIYNNYFYLSFRYKINADTYTHTQS